MSIFFIKKSETEKEKCPKCGKEYPPAVTFGIHPTVEYNDYCKCHHQCSYYSPFPSGSQVTLNGNPITENKKGWTCPVCGRGVSPDVKYCDHGEIQMSWYSTWT